MATLRTTAEAANYLRLHVVTLAKWRIASNDGPPFHKIGGKILYAQQDLDEWLERHRRTSTSDPGGDR